MITGQQQQTTLGRMKAARKLWLSAVPKECPTPEDFVFLLWLDTFPEDLVEFAIFRTAKKMRLNLHDGVPLIEKAAQRYCTSVLNHRMKDLGRLRSQQNKETQ